MHVIFYFYLKSNVCRLDVEGRGGGSSWGSDKSKIKWNYNSLKLNKLVNAEDSHIKAKYKCSICILRFQRNLTPTSLRKKNWLEAHVLLSSLPCYLIT